MYPYIINLSYLILRVIDQISLKLRSYQFYHLITFQYYSSFFLFLKIIQILTQAETIIGLNQVIGGVLYFNFESSSQRKTDFIYILQGPLNFYSFRPSFLYQNQIFFSISVWIAQLIVYFWKIFIFSVSKFLYCKRDRAKLFSFIFQSIWPAFSIVLHTFSYIFNQFLNVHVSALNFLQTKFAHGFLGFFRLMSKNLRNWHKKSSLNLLDAQPLTVKYLFKYERLPIFLIFRFYINKLQFIMTKFILIKLVDWTNLNKTRPFKMSAKNRLQEMKQAMIRKKQQKIEHSNTPLIPQPFPMTLPLLMLQPDPIPSILQTQKSSISPEEQKQQKHLNKAQNQNEQQDKQVKSVNLAKQKHDQIIRPQIDFLKPQMRNFSENISSLPQRLNLDDHTNQKQVLMKLTRYFVKDLDKIKETMKNLQESLKGIEHIRRKMKEDKLFYKKIKYKIRQIRQIRETHD